jgi:hypothetical protein
MATAYSLQPFFLHYFEIRNILHTFASLFMQENTALWCNWLTRLTLDQKSWGSSPCRATQIMNHLQCFSEVSGFFIYIRFAYNSFLSDLPKSYFSTETTEVRVCF